MTNKEKAQQIVNILEYQRKIALNHLIMVEKELAAEQARSTVEKNYYNKTDELGPVFGTDRYEENIRRYKSERDRANQHHEEMEEICRFAVNVFLNKKEND